MDYFISLKDWILDLVFPIRCLGCGKFPQKKYDGYVCRRCLNAIPVRQSSECIGCKRSMPLGRTCFLCVRENPIDNLFIVTNYDNPEASKLLAHYKYHFIRDIHEPLAQLARKYVKQLHQRKNFSLLINNPLIIPIPLHKRRQNWRGFNQSALIAEDVAHQFQMEYQPHVLRRIKHSKSQVEISQRENRLANVKNIFEYSDSIAVKGRSIILIDDICTTGATLNEAARVLKENGAQSVSALVLARG